MSTLVSPARGSLAAITLFVLTIDTALAQATPQLPTTVITPARQTQAIDDALPATSVITRADIERTQSVDIVSLLARETGVQFAQSGGRGTAASLFVRGANSSQVLVLVDGVRLNAGTSGAAAVGGIALDAIDRIEIVRGNLSSLYGSAAIGGVVQIFTRRGAEPGRGTECRRRAAAHARRPRQRRHGPWPGTHRRRPRRRHDGRFFHDRRGARGTGSVRCRRQPGHRRQRIPDGITRGDLSLGRDTAGPERLAQSQPDRVRQYGRRADGDPSGEIPARCRQRTATHSGQRALEHATCAGCQSRPQQQHRQRSGFVQQRRVQLRQRGGDVDERCDRDQPDAGAARCRVPASGWGIDGLRSQLRRPVAAIHACGRQRLARSHRRISGRISCS